MYKGATPPLPPSVVAVSMALAVLALQEVVLVHAICRKGHHGRLESWEDVLEPLPSAELPDFPPRLSAHQGQFCVYSRAIRGLPRGATHALSHGSYLGTRLCRRYSFMSKPVMEGSSPPERSACNILCSVEMWLECMLGICSVVDWGNALAVPCGIHRGCRFCALSPHLAKVKSIGQDRPGFGSVNRCGDLLSSTASVEDEFNVA